MRLKNMRINDTEFVTTDEIPYQRLKTTMEAKQNKYKENHT